MPRGMVIYNNVYIIQRGAFVLLVSTNRAMREPLHSGASDGIGSTFEPKLYFTNIDYQYVIGGRLMY